MKSIIRLRVLSLFILIVIFLSCKKEAVPILTTTPISNITGTTATSGGTISSEGSGTVIARGVCWSTAITPTIADSKTQDGAGAGAFTSNISGLNGGMVYYIRAYAINSSGTGYGMALSFSTLGKLPSALTQSATNILRNSATLNGIIDVNYLSTTVSFEYGTTSEYGSSVTSKQSPLSGNSLTSVTANISGLSENTTYHFRVKAINNLGTGYGADKTFLTGGNTVTDYEGNVYQTVRIGNQVWMKENLRTTTFNDGSTIPNTTDPVIWGALITPAYCWLNNDVTTNKNTYGALYNWYAVNTGKLCPLEWHVPTDSEWTLLTSYLGGESDAGGKLKESGTVHWASPNIGATNETTFSGLPGGRRYNDGKFDSPIGYGGMWWSTTEYSSTFVWFRGLVNNSASLLTGYHFKSIGFSVRCLRDK